MEGALNGIFLCIIIGAVGRELWKTYVEHLNYKNRLFQFYKHKISEKKYILINEVSLEGSDEVFVLLAETEEFNGGYGRQVVFPKYIVQNEMQYVPKMGREIELEAKSSRNS